MTEKSLTVSELTNLLRQDLESRWNKVWVTGEVSSPKLASSGHCYFTLKDAKASLSCVLWRSALARLGKPPEHGDQVELIGSLKVYPPRGSYQLDVRRWSPLGFGELEIRFKKLKEKLTQEGLFDLDRKRPLPFLPRRLALVTSATGAARHDMEKSIRDRFPPADLVVITTAVQGAEAVPGLVAALERAQREPEVDVIVCGRGGGSLEDLWAFNEELVVRAIATSQIPVVSAVGHEVDVTLADFAADERALTPTGVGPLVVPVWEELNQKFSDEANRLKLALRQSLSQAHWRLEVVKKSAAWNRLAEMVNRHSQYFDDLMESFHEQLRQKIEKGKMFLKVESGRLDSLSPLKVLARGYSVVTDEQGKMAQAQNISVGDSVSVRLKDGQLRAHVDEVTRD